MISLILGLLEKECASMALPEAIDSSSSFRNVTTSQLCRLYLSPKGHIETIRAINRFLYTFPLTNDV
mgnify:CR=1 FL=1